MATRPATIDAALCAVAAVALAGAVTSLVLAASRHTSGPATATLVVTAAALTAASALTWFALRQVRRERRQRWTQGAQSVLATELALARVSAEVHNPHFPQAMQISYLLEDEDDIDPDLLDAAQDATSGLRSLSVALDAPDYSISTFSSSLVHVQQMITSEHDLEVDWRWDLDERGTLDIHAAVLAYRVLQEALRNVAAHAQTTHVSVHVTREGGQLLMDVADDGIGFEPQAPLPLDSTRSKPRHVGLTVLRTRVAEAGGTLRVTSRPGHGTRVSLAVPLGHTTATVAVGPSPAR